MAENAYTIMQAKNADYAAGSDPYANFRGSELFAVTPEKGLAIRWMDKNKRVQSFLVNGKLQVANEGVEDAVADQYNYCILLGGILSEVGRLGSRPALSDRPSLFAFHQEIRADVNRVLAEIVFDPRREAMAAKQMNSHPEYSIIQHLASQLSEICEGTGDATHLIIGLLVDIVKLNTLIQYRLAPVPIKVISLTEVTQGMPKPPVAPKPPKTYG